MPDLEWSFAEFGAEGSTDGDLDDAGGLFARLASAVRPAGGGERGIVSRVFVLGTFGTEAVAERLAAVLRRRGRETHAVTTAEDAADRRAGGQRAPIETVVVEGTASTSSVRDARDLLGPPDVVVVTAVGRGHLASLGPGRGDVVRSIAAAVPEGAHVVNAEGSPAVAGYLETAVARRGATIEHVGDHDATAPGAELAGAIDGVLATLDESPQPASERDALAATSRPEWVDLPDGRLFDALGVTDTVAVERLRGALAGGGTAVELVAVLPRRRRDVAAALAAYADDAHDRSAVDRVHAVGALADRFERRCAAPTETYGPEASPDAVLSAALSHGPAMIVGSEDGVAAAGLSDAVDERIERSGTLQIG